MPDTQLLLALGIFFPTIILIIWRPFGINESIPTAVAAILVFLLGLVTFNDLVTIIGIVTGASITILSTIVMSIVLESLGFFRWAAFNLVSKAKGCGIKLYWYIMTLCFFMTMFFNNDGSILITTPIIIQIVQALKLKPHQKIPYLIGGALVATASSAPIGVSNLANLIALEIVGLDLNTYATLMFVPSMLGIISISSLILVYFEKAIPKNIYYISNSAFNNIEVNLTRPHHNILSYPPLHKKGLINPKPVFKKNSYLPEKAHKLPKPTKAVDWWMFRVCILVVIMTRAGFFILAGYGVPIEWIAIVGALLLIIIRWYRQGIGPYDVLRKTPWHIIIFAFSMYVIVYGLHNAGLTSMIVNLCRELVSSNHLNTCFIIGFLLTAMSNLFNNLPSVMIGTLSLTQMGLDPQTLHIAYLANIIGSDIGSLITPMGTLASLIWIFILRQHKIPITWGQYLKVTIRIIPIGLTTSLLSLFLWSEWLSK
ncbi:MAG: arsenic transporter [Bacillota bacterium]|jgi:arsenical pump membrane protein